MKIKIKDQGWQESALSKARFLFFILIQLDPGWKPVTVFSRQYISLSHTHMTTLSGCSDTFALSMSSIFKLSSHNSFCSLGPFQLGLKSGLLWLTAMPKPPLKNKQLTVN